MVASSVAEASTERYLTGPDATGNLLRGQDPPLSGELTLSGDYNIASFKAFDTGTGEEESASQVVRIYGEWKFEKFKGSVIFKMEYRDAFTDTAPTDFGLSLGYVGMLQSTFSDQQARLTTLYWKQELFNGGGLLLAGFLDVTEYVDVYLAASPWESFSNLAFATGSATIGGLPDGALGIMAGNWLGEHWYLSAGLADANADPANPFDGFETLFREGELFSSLEIGYVPARKALFLDNAHITLWHIDDRKEASTPEGWGVSFSWTRTIDSQAFAFLRGGWSDGGGALLDRSLSIGGAYLTRRQDVVGLGLNVGRPNTESFPGADRTQYTGELFYRWQAGKYLQVTPSLQYIRHPSLDTSIDSLTIAGLRLRVLF